MLGLDFNFYVDSWAKEEKKSKKSSPLNSFEVAMSNRAWSVTLPFLSLAYEGGWWPVFYLTVLSYSIVYGQCTHYG